jgi:CTP:molybdopterin cytidylyltransferase MocA
VSTVGGLVLAAGQGRRLGRPKADLRLGGETFAERAVAALIEGGCTAPVQAVVQPGITFDGPVVSSENHRWAQGMSTSLQLGLIEMAVRGRDAVVVTLVDTPLVGARHIRRLVEAWADGARVAVATYEGVRRTPVLLGWEHWQQVVDLAHGDVGARAFLDAHPDLVATVECADLGPWVDVDTAEDLDALQRR